jgi:hypothetical protein
LIPGLLIGLAVAAAAGPAMVDYVNHFQAIPVAVPATATGIANPTTSTTTIPSALAQPTTTTTTTVPVIAQPTTTTTGPVIARPTTPATTQPSIEVATTSTLPVTEQQPPTPPTTTTTTTGDAIVIGELVGDPTDLSDEMRRYVDAGADLEELAGHLPNDPGAFNDIVLCVTCLEITSGVAYLLGTDDNGLWTVYLEVTTNIPAKIGIEVWYPPGGTEPEGMEGWYHHELVTTWGVDKGGLDSCTTYPARAIAQDADGNLRVGYGSFETPCSTRDGSAAPRDDVATPTTGATTTTFSPADTDGDGFDDLEEEQSGTSPLDPNDHP